MDSSPLAPSGGVQSLTLDGLSVLARQLAPVFRPPMVVYLHGPLGAGKTSLMRELLHELGHQGSVPSPTFSLMESYCLKSATVHHFDLYRVENVNDLSYLGIRDRLDDHSIVVFEWPEKGCDAQGHSHLPKANLRIYLDYHPDNGEKRRVRWETHCLPGGQDGQARPSPHSLI